MSRTNAIPCPVLPLALEFNALVKAYNAADERSSSDETDYSKRAMMAIWDRLDSIRDQASYLLAASNAGAAFQIMQANVHLDTLVQEDEREQRRIEAQMVRLLYRATEYLMIGDNRLADARQFSMGEHINPHLILESIKQTRKAA